MALFCLKKADEALTEVKQNLIKGPAVGPKCEGFPGEGIHV